MTRSARARTVSAVIAVLLVAVAGMIAPAGAAAGKQKPLYWGAWIGEQLTGEQPPWDMGAVGQFGSIAGKGLSLVEFSAPFSDCSKSPCAFYEFPAKEMEAVRNYGAIPFYSWSSASSSGEVNDADYQLADVIEGRYDAYIANFAAEARNWGKPFFLRFNWEMNGNWFPWAEGVNGNKPGEFITAWRHVHDIFGAVGATNATWVWCPYADAKNKFGPLKRFYPGHAYVDWTCLDGYNWAKNPVNPQPWKTFEQLFERSYRSVVKKIAPKKPMVLAELASGGPAKRKATWIRQMFRELATDFTRIRGLIWFDKVDRGVQWPIETSTQAIKAFSQGVRKPKYRANIFSTYSASPIQPPR